MPPASCPARLTAEARRREGRKPKLPTERKERDPAWKAPSSTGMWGRTMSLDLRPLQPMSSLSPPAETACLEQHSTGNSRLEQRPKRKIARDFRRLCAGFGSVLGCSTEQPSAREGLPPNPDVSDR